MTFSRIFAQDIPIRMLRRSILDDQVGHALLFYGAEGIGKRTTAIAYAMALNCTDDASRATGDACGVCRSCRMIELNQHPDVRLLTPETTGGKTVIPIDAIRTKFGESPSHPLPLREDAQLKPLEGHHKVYIIDPANRPGLQEDAGNALLLTLEEPPPHVVIILISSRPSSVLPTLVSRCRPIRFQLAAYQDIRIALTERTTLDVVQSEAIAGMANGRIGWALAVANNPSALNVRHALLTEIDRALSVGRPAALRLAEMLHSLAMTDIVLDGDDESKGKNTADRTARRNLPELLDITASCWRDLLVTALDQSTLRVNRDHAEMFDRHAHRLTAESLRAGLHTIMQSKRIIERNANISLALERMWMKILP